jgi:hypothetical protein
LDSVANCTQLEINLLPTFFKHIQLTSKLACFVELHSIASGLIGSKFSLLIGLKLRAASDFPDHWLVRFEVDITAARHCPDHWLLGNGVVSLGYPPDNWFHRSLAQGRAHGKARTAHHE